MKHTAYTLEINGELCVNWINTNRKILKDEANALLPPYGNAKIEKISLTISRKRKK